MARNAKWWSRTRGIPAETYASWVTSLSAQPGRQVRVLAWARMSDGTCVASPSALSVGGDSGWTHLGWHEIETGGWDSPGGRLSWTRYGGEPGAVELSEPGRLPEVFRERVSASIVVEKLVPIRGGRGVLISGRRDLADGDLRITWNSTLQRGLTWQGDGVQAAVAEAVSQVRTEYDMG